MPIACWRSLPRSAPFPVDQQRAFTLALPPRRALADRVARRPQPPQPRARSGLARDRRGRRGDAQSSSRRRPPSGRARRRSVDNSASPTAIRRWPCARSCTSGGARSPSTAAPVSPAKRSFRSCSRPSPARVRSRSRRCRGARASICCCSCIGSRASRPAFTSCCAIPARKETLRGLMAPGFAWTPAGRKPAVAAALPARSRRCTARRRADQLRSGDRRRRRLRGRDAGGVPRPDRNLRSVVLPAAPLGGRRLVGQQLYLEAEASGIRATGIGCFFDDLTHRTFGLTGDALPGPLSLHDGRSGRRRPAPDGTSLPAPATKRSLP